MQLIKIIILVLTVGAFSSTAFASADHGHGGHGHDEHEEEPRGPHGGWWFEEDGIGLELAIVEASSIERDTPPKFHAWLYRDDELVDNAQAQLQLEVTRLGGETTQFQFNREGDHWVSEQPVDEPHSFDLTATLAIDGQQHQWSWESHEGRTRIDPAMAEQAGIETATAGPATLQRTLTTYGKLITAPDSVSHVRARFPGAILRVAADVGDTVDAGDLLAEVESNESLRRYAITAPIGGLVTQRDANLGESTGDRVLFTVANFDPLWAELQISPRQHTKVAAGQAVRITAEGERQETRIQALIPAESTPFVTARAKLNNSDGEWSPGLMVEGHIVVETEDVPLAVRNSALQQLGDWTVVFVNVDDIYEARPLEVGRSDGQFTEVISGLEAGDEYVVENSYLIKADIEKAGAAHAH